MWKILGSRSTQCDGSRRNFMKIGALCGFGMAGGDLLAGNLFGAEGQGVKKPIRSAIQIFLPGGPSHFETFDPKPDAPVEIRGPYSPISTNVAGTQICDQWPELAKIADKYSLVRSCCHDNIGHEGSVRMAYTGYKSASPEDELPHDYPYIGSVVAKVRGPLSDGMPTYLQLNGSGKKDAAFLGPAHSPMSVYSTGVPQGFTLSPTIPLARIDDRRALLSQLDKLQRDAGNKLKMDGIDSLTQQAYGMLQSAKTKEAFELGKESPETRRMYGDTQAGNSCLLARRFVEAGAGFVSIRTGSWDHHGNAGGTITKGNDENAPQVDKAVAALLLDLERRGMTDNVVVYLWGEFGRTPRINSSFGRDHWPNAMSVLVSGGGLKNGRVVGATNKKGEHPIDRSCSPGDVLATIYRQLGVDFNQSFINTAGRPIPVLNGATPIAELL